MTNAAAGKKSAALRVNRCTALGAALRRIGRRQRTPAAPRSPCSCAAVMCAGMSMFGAALDTAHCGALELCSVPARRHAS